MTDSNAAASIPTKRSYRACINCRRHKTKCDLGDVNAPASPPCSKCRRTRTECVFAPGKRGGLDKSEAKNDSERSRDMSDRPDTGLHQPRHNTTRSVNESIERDTTTPLSAINRDFSYNGVDQSSTSRLNTSPVITSNNTIHQSFSQPNISDYSASYPALRTDSSNTAFIQDTQGFSRAHPSTSNPAQPSLLSVDSYQGQGLASRDPFSNGKHTGDGLSETLLATSNNQQLGQNGHDFNVDASQYILSTPLPTQDRISSHSADRGREMSVVGQAIPGDAFVGHSMDNSFDSFTHEGGPQHSSVNLLDEAGQQVEPSLRSQKQSLPRVTSRSPRQRWLGSGHNNLDRGSDTPLHRSTATLTDPRSFVINTGMHNESDALQILAMAATSSEKDKNRLGKRQRSVSDVDGLGMQRARDGFRTEIDRDRDFDHAGYDSKSQQGSSSRQNDMASPANTDGHHRSPAEVMELQRRQNAQNDEMHRNANGQSIAIGDACSVDNSQEETDNRRHGRGRLNVSFQDVHLASGMRISAPQPVDFSSFPLVAKGILDPEQVYTFGKSFFTNHHFMFPLLSPSHTPKTEEDFAVFARDEPYLMTVFIIIASRLDIKPSAKRIHAQAWSVMKEYIADVELSGAAPTIGLVEGVLLLAENLPREKPFSAETTASDATRIKGLTGRSTQRGCMLDGFENRQAWMLIGGAIRMAYGLGIDQLAHQVDQAPKESERRATIAWTYCYIFDRHISIRTGRAFWSRGPALCFRGYSSIDQTGPAGAKENFPSLCDLPIPVMENAQTADNEKETATESAELLQAYLELTQFMTNVHDVFYPSETRLHSLVNGGEYFKYLDGFNICLENFKLVWSNKNWSNAVQGHLIWVMFHYSRLYASSFAFQAHVTRTTERASVGKSVKDAASNFFPRSAAATPDALYIYESINAGKELLNLFIDNLHRQGYIQYLPSRYLLWCQYAAVFLLKAVYSGAIVQTDCCGILHQIEELCGCLLDCSEDINHPAVRYGQMLRLLASRLAMQATSASRLRVICRTRSSLLTTFRICRQLRVERRRLSHETFRSSPSPTRIRVLNQLSGYR
jgi:hypothetical protein